MSGQRIKFLLFIAPAILLIKFSLSITNYTGTCWTIGDSCDGHWMVNQKKNTPRLSSFFPWYIWKEIFFLYYSTQTPLLGESWIVFQISFWIIKVLINKFKYTSEKEKHSASQTHPELLINIISTIFMLLTWS